jgi:hypothetical protein
MPPDLQNNFKKINLEKNVLKRKEKSKQLKK